MTDTIKAICENLGNELDIPMSTSLLEISRRLTSETHPLLAAFVSHRVEELT